MTQSAGMRNRPVTLGVLLIIVGAGLMLRYLMPTLTLPLSRPNHGPLRPQIVSAAYVGRTNARSFDVTTQIRSQCQAGAVRCVVACSNKLAGDPDFGQGKTCEIHYQCGETPPQILRMPEGRREWILCQDATAPRWGARGEHRPQISSATYSSSGSGQSIDLTPWVRAQCQVGASGCIVGCNNDLSGDPGLGQSKTCEIRYQCGENPPQTLRMPEGRWKSIRCE